MSTVFIPIPNTVRGYLVSRRFGIPICTYMEGSVIKRIRFGVTKWHALERARVR